MDTENLNQLHRQVKNLAFENLTLRNTSKEYLSKIKSLEKIVSSETISKNHTLQNESNELRV